MLDRPVLEAAPLVLGCIVETNVRGARVAVRIREVEAYDGANDPASHAYRGRTPRTDPMFDGSGTVYVYLSYGVHWCMNVVVDRAGTPAAVLLRGGDVVHGIDTARLRRGRVDHLADGPGKLGQALGIDGDVSGTKLGDVVTIHRPRKRPDKDAIVRTARIGISKAADRPWRFVLPADATV